VDKRNSALKRTDIFCRQQSSNLTLRGRRLVLQYINGSPCGPGQKKVRRDSTWDDDEYPVETNDHDKVEGSRRKSATISFHCDKDPLATTASATFVSVDPDECAYSFEILSVAACVGAEPAKQGVGPGAVFAIIGVIAILVYFLGGVFYQRNVAHARGWRQLPNYSMWAGIGSFIKVSGQRCFRRLKYTFYPRVTSVREGMLPTMEVRASSRRSRSRSSRPSWESGHFA
jgi:cation-dependent mannose-6-phosphate receptor